MRLAPEQRGHVRLVIGMRRVDRLTVPRVRKRESGAAGTDRAVFARCGHEVKVIGSVGYVVHPLGTSGFEPSHEVKVREMGKTGGAVMIVER